MKIRIEMEVPDGMDTSTVLELMQGMAVEWLEAYDEIEADPEETDDESNRARKAHNALVDHVQNVVSVEVLLPVVNAVPQHRTTGTSIKGCTCTAGARGEACTLDCQAPCWRRP